MNKTVTLIGNGTVNTTIDGGGGTGPVVQINANWVNISGFKMINVTGIGLNLDSVSNCKISNINCSDCNDGIVLRDSSSNTLANNTCDLNGWHGIRIYSSPSNTLVNNTMVENGIFIEGDSLNYWNTHTINTSNKVNGKPVYYWKNQNGGTIPAGAGQVILANCTNVIVQNQNVSDGTGGIELGFSNKNTLKNNTCNFNKYVGIPLYFSSSNTITNNTCNSNIFGDGIHLQYYSNSNTLVNNTCNLNGANGIYLRSSSDSNTIDNNTCMNNANGIAILSISNTIASNICNSNSQHGIYLESSSGNTIENNTCNSNGQYGIRISLSSGNTLANNTYNLNGYSGIYLRNSLSNTIENNTCNGNEDGIYLVDFSHSNTIANNNCSSNDGGGIYLERSSSNRLVNNTMVDDGISIFGDLLEYWNTHTINTSNKVNGKPVYYWKNVTGGKIPAGAGQVILANCTNVIVGNQNLSNGSVGILLGFSTKNNITNNTCNGNTQYSIKLDYSSSNTLTNNTCYSNKYYGIHLLSSSSNTIVNNSCNSNEHFGIYLRDYSNSNTLANNTCNGNDEHGIFIWENSNSNTLENNTCKGNNDDGIGLDDSNSNTITNNTCILNGRFGIYLDSSSSNMMVNNNCNSNQNGIELDSSSSNTIANNTCNSNNNGIYLESSSNSNMFANNTCNSNSDHGIYIISSSSNTLLINTCNSNNNGIELYYSSSNTIENNTFNSNNIGIQLYSSSNSNTLENNTCNSNFYGIYIDSSSNANKIVNNTLESQIVYGIHITVSDNNWIYHNNFINNTNHAWDNGTNFWNATYPTGGNYFDNWTSPDINSDGFVDKPFNISGGTNKDYWPFAQESLWKCHVHNLDKNTWHLTIQEGIDNADARNTIWVGSGTYYENVIVNKTINLTGEDRDTTIIDGGGSGDVVYIIADWVNVSGFTVTGSGVGNNDAGIELYYTDRCKIENSNCSSNYRGIYLESSSSNTLENNTCNSNNKGIYLRYLSNSNTIENNICNGNKLFGIYLDTSSNSNTLDNNTCNSNHYYGIHLSGSSSNTLVNNTCNSNSQNGIYMTSSSSNTFVNNTCNSNTIAGIYLSSSSSNTLVNNTMVEDGIFIDGASLEHWNTHIINTSNKVNGKPVYYWKNATGGNVPAGAGQVILANCINVIVENQNVSNGGIGILLGFSNNNNITNNTCNLNSCFGIYLLASSNSNTLDNNTCNGNTQSGIRLERSSSNTLANNTCISNNKGIYVYDSSGNTLTKNTCNQNGGSGGISLDKSSSNTLVNNTCLSNYQGISVFESSNSNTITNNTCNGNNDHGIYLDSSNNMIENNTCNSNNYDGILVGGGGNTIANNTCNSNTNNGIYLRVTSDNTLTNNTCNSNTNKGISLYYSSSNTLANNTCNENTKQGIYLDTSSSNTLVNNTCNSNNEWGIDLIASSSNTLINNTCNYNDLDGIRLVSISCNNIIINCSLSLNKNYDLWLESNSVNNTALNTNFNTIKVLSSSSLIVKNYLHIQVNDSTDLPLQDVDIQVKDNNTIIYATSGYGGTNPKTDAFGQIKWLIVTDRIYNGSSTASENSTTLNVKYGSLPFRNNNRDVNMSTSHFEYISPNLLPTKIILQTPSNNSYLDDKTPKLSWNTATDGDNEPLTYYVQVDEYGGDWSSLVDSFHSSTAVLSWNITSTLSEGQSYQWRVCANDGFNNGSWSNIWRFTIDTMAPPAPTGMTATPAGWTNTNSFNIDWTNPGDTSGIVAGAYYKLDSAPTSATDGTWVGAKPLSGITVSGDGAHTIYIWLKDTLGHINHLNYGTAELRYDGTPPDAPIVSSTSHQKDTWVNNNAPAFTWTAPSDLSGILGYSYTLDQTPDTAPDTVSEGAFATASFSNRPDGAWYFHVRAMDGAGNWGTTDHYKIKIDVNGPDAEAASVIIDEGSEYSNDLVLDLKWNNFLDVNGAGIAGYYYSFTNNGGTTDGIWTTGPNGTLVGSSEGEYAVYVWAKDHVGNIGPASTASIIIKFPSVTDLKLSAQEVYRTRAIIFTSNCFDPVDAEDQLVCELQYSVEGGSWIGLSTTYMPGIGGCWQAQYTPSTNAAPGVYHIRVRYTNLNGSGTDWTTRSFIVLNNEPVINMPDTTFKTDEDNDLLIDLSLYGSDIEDPSNNLQWTITTYDPSKIIETQQTTLNTHHLTLTPGADWFGSTFINLSLEDADGASVWVNLTLIWESVNDAPIVKNPIADFSIAEDHTDPTTVDLNTVFYDVDTSILDFSASGNEHIAVTINPDGSVIFVPEADWTGSELIRFSASDRIASPTIENVMVTITPVNDIPLAFINTSIRTSILGQKLTIEGHGIDIDGNIIEYNWTSDIDGRRSDTLTLDTSTLSYGLHTLTFSVKDNEGAWSHPVIMRFEVTAPDLVIEDIKLSSDDITEGETVEITATITNQGDAEATNITVVIYDGDRKIGSKTIEVIAPNSSAEVSINWEPDKGDHSVKVLVLSENNDIIESDTDNNQLSLSLNAKMDWTPYIIMMIVVIIIVLIILMMLYRANRNREKVVETISEMEAEIEQAKKLGLPAAELEKVLADAKGVKKAGRNEDLDKKVLLKQTKKL